MNICIGELTFTLLSPFTYLPVRWLRLNLTQSLIIFRELPISFHLPSFSCRADCWVNACIVKLAFTLYSPFVYIFPARWLRFKDTQPLITLPGATNHPSFIVILRLPCWLMFSAAEEADQEQNLIEQGPSHAAPTKKSGRLCKKLYSKVSECCMSRRIIICGRLICRGLILPCQAKRTAGYKSTSSMFLVIGDLASRGRTNWILLLSAKSGDTRRCLGNIVTCRKGGFR